MLKVIELFAGVGSQTQALKNIGIDHEVVAISEIDKYAINSYEQLHGKVNNLGDISKIDKLPKADLWTYSFPCQDLSMAGKQKGIDENTRSGLLYQVERLLNKSKENNEFPKYLLLENVKNLVGKKFKGDFDKWLNILSDYGYINYWKVLNAKDYGIPQNRERVFCISILGDSIPYQFPNPIPLELRLRDMLENDVDDKFYISNAILDYIVANNEKWTGNNNSSLINKSVASAINTGEGSRRCDASNFICNDLLNNYDIKRLVQLGSLTNKPYDKMHESSKRVYSTVGISPTIHCCGGGNLEPKIMLPIVYDEQNKYFRKDNCVGTITTDGSSPKQNNRIMDLSHKVRKLTPKECWRLMGWKDEQIDRIKGISNSQLYKQAGNGIVVQVLEAIFTRLFIDTKINDYELSLFDYMEM